MSHVVSLLSLSLACFRVHVLMSASDWHSCLVHVCVGSCVSCFRCLASLPIQYTLHFSACLALFSFFLLSFHVLFSEVAPDDVSWLQCGHCMYFSLLSLHASLYFCIVFGPCWLLEFSVARGVSLSGPRFGCCCNVITWHFAFTLARHLRWMRAVQYAECASQPLQHFSLLKRFLCDASAWSSL